MGFDIFNIFRKKDKEVKSEDTALDKIDFLTFKNDNKTFLNKKTNRKNENFGEEEICSTKMFKYQTEIKNDNKEIKFVELYKLVLENNKLIKQLSNKLNSLDNNNSINNEYSYKLISPDLRGIASNPPKGVKNLKFYLVLKNDGNKDWPEFTTKFKIDKKATGFKTNVNEIMLGFLGVGQEKEFVIDIDIEGNLEVKKYQLVLDFCVGDKKYGNKIFINFQVIEDKKDEFRAKYLIDEKIASDSTVIRELTKFKGDFPKAYNSIMSKSINDIKGQK